MTNVISCCASLIPVFPFVDYKLTAKAELAGLFCTEKLEKAAPSQSVLYLTLILC